MWNVGDIAMCVSSLPWYNVDPDESPYPTPFNLCPQIFHQYVVIDIEYHENEEGEIEEYLDFAELEDGVWWSERFIKANDPTSIKEDNVDIPIRKTVDA